MTTPRAPRQLIVVDVETNGLDLERHQAIEVAWWNLTTNERGYFIPRHDVHEVLATAELEALRINRYIERIAGLLPMDDGRQADELWGQFVPTGIGDPDGVRHTLVGCNPRFDAAMVTKVFVRSPVTEFLEPEPWHHRLWDLSTYAAGVLGLDELPGLSTICELLGIEPGDHTAEADVTATALCFRVLQAKAGI